MPAARRRDGRRRRARRRGRAPHARRRRGRRGRLVPRRRRARALPRVDAGADAVHPGYGFLAESAAFAEGGDRRRADVGRPAAPRRSGSAATSWRRSGSRARRACRCSGPTGPDPARRLGFPVLVKAAAGGGGRGMRVVHEPDELDEALAGAAREAEAAFGDGTVFCRALPRAPAPRRGADPRRRRRGVLARPARLLRPAAPPEGRRGDTAPLAPARAGRRSIEALPSRSPTRSATGAPARPSSSSPAASFLPRAERPHPGRAPRHRGGHRAGPRRAAAPRRRRRAGRRSPSRRQGHAIEARLYAEDPRTFLPQAGTLERLSFPDGIRVDAGVAEGDEVGVSYDPMIAKLIAHGESRAEALDRLTAALDATVAEGVTTNLPFLRWLVRHPGVRRRRPLDGVPHRLPAALGTAAAAAARARSRLPGGSTCRRRAPSGPISTPRHRRTRRREAAASSPPCPARWPSVKVALGDAVTRAAAARRARGDEDGAAGDRAVRRESSPRCTSPRATASPAASCSSSWSGRRDDARRAAVPRDDTFARRAARMDELVAELRERTELVARGGGAAALERHRSRGKLPARERIDLLVDPGSAFLELNALAAWEHVRRRRAGGRDRDRDRGRRGTRSA